MGIGPQLLLCATSPSSADSECPALLLCTACPSEGLTSHCLLSQELCDPLARLVAFTFLEVGLEKILVQLGFYLSMHVYVNSAYDSGWRKMAATQLSVFGQGEGSEAWSSQSNQRLVYPSFLCLVQVKQETTQGKHTGLAIFCSPSPWCRLASKAVGGNNSVQPFQCLFTDLLSINPFWPRSSHLLSPLLVEG